MLHLRVTVPPELTDTVTELLVREPGVVHITMGAAAAVDPAGDVLEADVEHAALSALISRLQDLHVDRVGSGRMRSGRSSTHGRQRPTPRAWRAHESATTSSPGTRWRPVPATTPL